MWTRKSIPIARHATRALAIGLLLAGLPANGWAQAPPLLPAGTTPELVQLKERVERRFQVLHLRQGLVLVPRGEPKRVANIELSDGVVLVEGTPVTGKELRDWIGSDSDLVLPLTFLDAATRQRLFAPAAGAPVPARPEPSGVTPAPPTAESGWTERERYRYGGARVRVGGDVFVKDTEAVGDDVVVVLGSAHVDGRVDGDVVAVGGSVYLGPKAQVRGGVTSVGGGVERVTGSSVNGPINEVKVSFPSVGPFVRIRPWQDWSWFSSPFGRSVELIGTLVRVMLLGLFAALVVAIAPRPVRRVADRVSTEPWRAGLVGLAAQILFIPLLVLTVIVLAISIIGIPLLLLVPFAILAAIIVALLGLTGAGCALGEFVSRRSGSATAQNLLPSLLVGLAVIWALTVIARFAGLAGMPIRVIVGGVLVAGFLIEYLAWTIGLGGVLLSRFGRRGPADHQYRTSSVPGLPVTTPSDPSL